MTARYTLIGSPGDYEAGDDREYRTSGGGVLRIAYVGHRRLWEYAPPNGGPCGYGLTRDDAVRASLDAAEAIVAERLRRECPTCGATPGAPCEAPDIFWNNEVRPIRTPHPTR